MLSDWRKIFPLTKTSVRGGEKGGASVFERDR